MAAYVELPEFMNGKTVERFYGRVLKSSASGSHRESRRIDRGLNMARSRDAKMLKFLDAAATVLQKCSESQQDRFEEGKVQAVQTDGVVEYVRAQFPRQDFTEFSTVRAAYTLADNGKDPSLMRVYGHVYAAAADEILGEL
jgi:hypothetical protein